MSERKSPPGPREMVQEHRVINSYSGIHFEQETPPTCTVTGLLIPECACPACHWEQVADKLPGGQPP